MKRDLTRLADNFYDLLVIGGGVYGACVAWDAALRGLSVALVEKSDFGSGTSANSLKFIHGGLRYLQHADLKRMRESICERRNLMRIAPHLVHPIPVLAPAYGNWTERKGVLKLALALNDLIGFDRNRLADPQKHLPRGRVLSRRETMDLLPGIKREGLTGAILFHDAQVYNSERLVLSFLRSAEKAGADLANYAEVTGFLRSGESVTGVRVRDCLAGTCFDLRAKTVVNAAGPWVDRVQRLLAGRNSDESGLVAKAVNLVTRPLLPGYAVGVASETRYRDANALVKKGSRLHFLVPWRGHSLIGTTYSAFGGDPDDFMVNEEDVQTLLKDVNQGWPAAQLGMEDVSFVHGGLLPSSGVHPTTGDPQLAKRYRIQGGLEGTRGMISVVGVKYTTARQVAEKVVDRVFETWGRKPPKSSTADTPLQGGNIEQWEKFLEEEVEQIPFSLERNTAERLLLNYGASYRQVLKHVEKDSSGFLKPVDDLAVWKAEVRHGVREEMAQKLSDVVFRRTELGTAGHPGQDVLKACAETMGAELGWDAEKIQRQLQEAETKFLIPGAAR